MMNQADPDDDDLNTDDESFLDADDDTFENVTGDSDGDDEFEEFDEPPILCGVVNAHISEVKPNPKNPKHLFITIKSEEPGSQGAEATWYFNPANKGQPERLRKFVAIFGIESTKQPAPAHGFRLPKDWKKQLKNKQGLFVVDTWHKDDGTINSSIAWGMPKDARSPEWAEYAKSKNFNDAQLKAIKNSQGVIPPESAKLFEE